MVPSMQRNYPGPCLNPEPYWGGGGGRGNHHCELKWLRREDIAQIVVVLSVQPHGKLLVGLSLGFGFRALV